MSILKVPRQWTNSVNLDETALYELSHLDLCCLQIQLFIFGALSSNKLIAARSSDNPVFYFSGTSPCSTWLGALLMYKQQKPH